MHTFQQFSLESTEKNYRAALALPSDSPTRALRTEEYIWALETALHGSVAA